MCFPDYGGLAENWLPFGFSKRWFPVCDKHPPQSYSHAGVVNNTCSYLYFDTVLLLCRLKVDPQLLCGFVFLQGTHFGVTTRRKTEIHWGPHPKPCPQTSAFLFLEGLPLKHLPKETHGSRRIGVLFGLVWLELDGTSSICPGHVSRSGGVDGGRWGLVAATTPLQKVENSLGGLVGNNPFISTKRLKSKDPLPNRKGAMRRGRSPWARCWTSPWAARRPPRGSARRDSPKRTRGPGDSGTRAWRMLAHFVVPRRGGNDGVTPKIYC